MAFAGYLKMDGIKGESTDDGHKDQVEILSYSHQLTQAGGAASSRTGGNTGSRVDVGDFAIVKVLDCATPNLAKFCCTGKNIPSIVLELTTAGETAHVYMKYTLTNAVVASVRQGGSSNGEGARPLEEVTFRPTKIEWAYTAMGNDAKAGAAVNAGWDLSANKAS